MQLIVLTVLLALLLAGASPVKWNAGYLDRSTTSTVNGFFIWLVFLSHFASYATSCIDNHVGNLLKQCVVSPFLFYSGFGCVQQYMERGHRYLEGFGKRRILPTLVNFDIAVCVFAITCLAIGKPVGMGRFALSLVAWESIGNSNWYIFSIICCYVLFLAVFSVPLRTGAKARGWLFLAVNAVLVLVLSRIRAYWWYDSLMAFGAGVVYGIWRTPFEKFAKRNYFLSFGTLAAVYVSAGQMPYLSSRAWLCGNMQAVSFAAMIVMATMKISLKSPLLAWSGARIFPIYIYQRLPMVAMAWLAPEWFASQGSCWLPFAMSILSTISIAAVYPALKYPWRNHETRK